MKNHPPTSRPPDRATARPRSLKSQTSHFHRNAVPRPDPRSFSRCGEFKYESGRFLTAFLTFEFGSGGWRQSRHRVRRPAVLRDRNSPTYYIAKRQLQRL